MNQKINTLFAVGALGASLALSACQKSARQQQEEATEARRELNETRQEAQKDIAEAQRRVREAEAEVRAAPPAARADAVLAPNRDEYLKNHRDELAELDRKVASLEADAAKASGKAKAELDAKVKRLKEQRAAVGRQLDSAATVTGAAWSSFTANLDKAMDDFEGAVEKAVK